MSMWVPCGTASQLQKTVDWIAAVIGRPHERVPFMHQNGVHRTNRS